MHSVHAPAFNRYRSLQSKSLPLSHVVPSHPQSLILNAFTFDLANQRFHKKPLLLGITPHIMGGLQMLIIIKKHISIVIILHCIDIFTFSYITYILYKVSLKKMILYKVVQLQKTNSLSKLVPHK